MSVVELTALEAAKEAATESSPLVGIVTRFGELIGLDAKLVQLMGLGGPTPLTLDDIKDVVRQQVEEVLFEGEVESHVNDTAGKLVTLRRFLSEDYQAQLDTHGEATPNATLWTYLDSSSVAPRVSDLEDAANALENWITDTDKKDKPALAIKAMQVWVALWLHICVFRKERAKVGDTTQSPPEAQAMRRHARDAVTAIVKRYNAVWAKRVGILVYRDETWSPVSAKINVIHDDWLQRPGGATAIRQTVASSVLQTNAGFFNQFSHLHGVWDVYRWVLWNANDDATGALRTHIEALKGDPWNSDFLSQSFDLVEKFGKWARGVRKQLCQLDLVASGIAATAQEGWSYCDQCGVLYFAPAHSCCIANPIGPRTLSHGQNNSHNYVLRCEAVDPPQGMQDGWRWCRKCGVLFFSWGNSVCTAAIGNWTGIPSDPASMGHDGSGSGNYLLGTGSAPPANQRGFDVQEGWRWCKNCGALHFADGQPSSCPAGERHSTEGSGAYWLPFLGDLPRTGGGFGPSWKP